MLDNSDQAGALGHHDVTSGGLPMGKVFAATDLAYDQQWTVTASHELLEMIADPQIDLTVFVQPDENTGTLYAYEVCDACEADEFAYDIDGSLVSDFVYPAWFESYRQSDSTKFDFQDQIKTPFELLRKGTQLDLIFHDDHWRVCSALVADCYSYAGITIDSGLRDPNLVSPADLYNRIATQ